MADTISSEGFVQSAPAYTTTSNVSRAAVQSQAVQTSRVDAIAAEGFRAPTQQAAGQRSRDAVRAEAAQANRQAFAASAQMNEGVI
ncbi:MAG: hypothetical protein EOP93_14455 [Lysobacteraceae bacterium]|nr:MAG: hypothetical protein EOP93_14455 [Xanthomonadaceae bacterium]